MRRLWCVVVVMAHDLNPAPSHPIHRIQWFWWVCIYICYPKKGRAVATAKEKAAKQLAVQERKKKQGAVGVVLIPSFLVAFQKPSSVCLFPHSFWWVMLFSSV
jgi:hypothetical protein